MTMQTHTDFIEKTELARVYLQKHDAAAQTYVDGLYQSDAGFTDKTRLT